MYLFICICVYSFSANLDCPVRGCSSKGIQGLDKHLLTVHKLKVCVELTYFYWYCQVPLSALTRYLWRAVLLWNIRGGTAPYTVPVSNHRVSLETTGPWAHPANLIITSAVARRSRSPVTLHSRGLCQTLPWSVTKVSHKVAHKVFTKWFKLPLIKILRILRFATLKMNPSYHLKMSLLCIKSSHNYYDY